MTPIPVQPCAQRIGAVAGPDEPAPEVMATLRSNPCGSPCLAFLVFLLAGAGMGVAQEVTVYNDKELFAVSCAICGATN